MGTFSTGMRSVATRLITKLGNPCTLTKVTKGQYDPLTGLTSEAEVPIKTFSAPVKKVSDEFGLMGMNTNLTGFSTNKIIVPWIGQEIDTTWKYNNDNITAIESVRSQGDIVIYTITVGEK